MKLPPFVKHEVDQIYAQLAPEKASVSTLLSQQANYNKKPVLLKGTVNSVVSVDETDEKTVGTWFLNLPTTVKLTASATYFYIETQMGQEILVKYPADLDVSTQDNITVVGIFCGYGITMETKGLLGIKREQVLNDLGEPFIGAITVENETKQKMEYIRNYYIAATLE
jgi:hypothetical protein